MLAVMIDQGCTTYGPRARYARIHLGTLFYDRLKKVLAWSSLEVQFLFIGGNIKVFPELQTAWCKERTSLINEPNSEQTGTAKRERIGEREERWMERRKMDGS